MNTHISICQVLDSIFDTLMKSRIQFCLKINNIQSKFDIYDAISNKQETYQSLWFYLIS